MIFVVANEDSNKPVLINPTAIRHITTKVGISGTPWANSLKTEIRYGQGNVAYSDKLPHEIEIIELFTT